MSPLVKCSYLRSSILSVCNLQKQQQGRWRCWSLSTSTNKWCACFRMLHPWDPEATKKTQHRPSMQKKIYYIDDIPPENEDHVHKYGNNREETCKFPGEKNYKTRTCWWPHSNALLSSWLGVAWLKGSDLPKWPEQHFWNERFEAKTYGLKTSKYLGICWVNNTLAFI